MFNQDIRQEVADAGLRLWQIADHLNMKDCNFSRVLRKELSGVEKERIRRIIADIRAKESGPIVEKNGSEK